MTEQEEKSPEQFLRNWRMSEFYSFVMKAIDEELGRSYVRDVVLGRTLENLPMEDEAIGREVRVEVQVELRLKKLKEVLS
jgi:hypothetical protein